MTNIRATRMAGPMAALSIAALFVVAGTAQTRPAETSPPPAEIPPVDFKPIGYFNDRCGSCHGNYGSFWGEGFAKHLDDAALRNVVKEMADGPAQAPLDDQPLAALVAYHRSLVDGAPFLIVTHRTDSSLHGEVTPGSTVVIEQDNHQIPAKVVGHTWTAALDNPNAPATITANHNEKTTHLPAGAWHSHIR